MLAEGVFLKFLAKANNITWNMELTKLFGIKVLTARVSAFHHVIPKN